MSIRCGLGLHQATPVARWNDGYYFSSCRRCGRDLIRTPFESWHVVPRGHRVVWSATAPANRRTAMLAREGEASAQAQAPLAGIPPRAAARSAKAAPPPERRGESDDSLPIIEVLRLLREDEDRQTQLESVTAAVEGFAPAELQLAADAALESAIARSAPLPRVPAEAAPAVAGAQALDQPVTVSWSDVGDPFDDDFMADPDQSDGDEDFWAEPGGCRQRVDTGSPEVAPALAQRPL